MAWERFRAPSEAPIYEVSWTLCPKIVRKTLLFALAEAAERLPGPLSDALVQLEERPCAEEQGDPCPGLVNRLIAYLDEIARSARPVTGAALPVDELPSPRPTFYKSYNRESDGWAACR